MSGKPQKNQQQKRKAEAPAQQNNGNKKAKEAPAAAPAKKAEPKQQQQQQPKKKAAKAPEPEPESEEDDEEDAPRNEEGIKAVEAVQDEQDKITNELEALDEQQNAEIFAIQKKFLLKKRPILATRDQLCAKVPELWKTLITEHEVFNVQLEEIDLDILTHLTTVEVSETYSDPSAEKQQIESIAIAFTFSAGSKLVKAGKFSKTFKFNDETETLECVATPTAKLPFVNAASFAKEHQDSFFQSWYTSAGHDEGILHAQDSLSSELYVDPLQLYRHVCEGGSLADLQQGDDSDEEDDDGLGMVFEESDDEAPELA